MYIYICNMYNMHTFTTYSYVICILCVSVPCSSTYWHPFRSSRLGLRAGLGHGRRPAGPSGVKRGGLGVSSRKVPSDGFPLRFHGFTLSTFFCRALVRMEACGGCESKWLVANGFKFASRQFIEVEQNLIGGRQASGFCSFGLRS